jgi:hypothetical protein
MGSGRTARDCRNFLFFFIFAENLHYTEKKPR